MSIIIDDIEIELTEEQEKKYRETQKNIEEKYKRLTGGKNLKLDNMKSLINNLKHLESYKLNNVPIIENDTKLHKYEKEFILSVLNKSLIIDIKEIKNRKKNPIGMFCNARYEESDNTYYGDIYLKNLDYKKFKQVNHEIISDNNGIIKFITFYVRKS